MNKIGIATLCVGLLCASNALCKVGDTLLFDFESGMQGWQVADGKFGSLHCGRDVYHHSGEKYNKKGKYFLSTLDKKNGGPDDSHTGVVESPVFTLLGPTVTMIIGGGGSKSTYAAICEAETGKEYARGAGKNEQVMHPVEWNVPELVGKKVFIKLVDNNTGGWGHITLDHVIAKGRVDKAATAKLRKGRVNNSLTGEIEPALKSLADAVSDLGSKFKGEYSAKEYLAKIEKIRHDLQADNVDMSKIKERLDALQRQALVMSNPLLTEHPILYVARDQYPSDHHNTATMFQTDEINTGKYKGRGYLKTVDFSKGGKVTTLLNPGATSTPRDIEVSFDGRQVVFSMRKSVKDNYHIYSINADGGGLKQLTSAEGVFDIDPLYLANGQIAFTSSRDPKYCMCNRHIMGNLFKMDADGANIHQLGVSTLFEGHGSLMPDGRILYYRWEYVDRNFGDAQGLWVVNPDGTNHAVYWGNNTGSPGGVLDGRIIPGTQLCISTLSSCHDRPWGAIGIIDRNKGIDSPDAIIRTWPEDAKKLCNPNGSFDTFKRVKPKYEDPFPLSENFFLVSRQVGGKMGICLIDLFGNEIVLHTDEKGCFDPMPLGPRQRPEPKPEMRDYKNDKGVFYVQDVYIGTHMKGIERGSVKYLRVIESPPKKNWTPTQWGGQGVHCPGMNWHNFENKRILGTVPVEDDGSVHFECPSDKFVFFQLLDENGMMVQSMRSGTMIQSGETQGCVGCHESRTEASMPMAVRAKALRRAPSKLNGWYGEPRMFSFQKEIQPIFDKHCVKCHDFNKPAGEKLILAGDRTVSFSASYIDLWSKEVIKCVGGGPAAIQQAKSWGSHPSTLIKVVREGHKPGTVGYEKHKGVKLSNEEIDKLITWVDLNAPYYPYYECAYPNNPTGRSPIDGKQFNRLRQLTGAKFVTGHGRNKRAMISFERPELSPCLAKLDKNSAEYKEALSIIQAGKEQLEKLPRADMDGFVPCVKDTQRLEKYDRRVEIEQANRKAILEGEKVYDKNFE